MATSIVYQGDETAAKAYLPQAQNLLYKVKAFAKASGVAIYSLTLNLDASAYCVALTTTTNDYIQIFAAPTSTYYVPLRNPPPTPDFLSGVVKDGVIVEITPNVVVLGQPPAPPYNVLEVFKPTTTCYQRENTKAHASNQGDYPSGYANNKRLGIPVSNLLTEFVQDPYYAQEGQAGVLTVSQYTGRMQKLVQILLGYGIPNGQQSGLQVMFDYTFSRCHGIYRSPIDQTDWLIQIGNSGVLAMPLYLYPNSKSLSKSQYQDIAAAATEFNGLPIGIPFPTGNTLTSALANGDVLQLMTAAAIAPFYENSPYSTACGWAFNQAGDTANNTAYYYSATNGLPYSVHYQIDIQIGGLIKNRKKGSPLANGFASLNLVESGIAYNGAKITPPCFKLYEPLLGGLLSFTFQQPATPPPSFAVSCDTTMYVYYSGGQLKKIKYYLNPTVATVNESTNQNDPCMYIGEWTSTSYSGARYIPASFYTTDVDDRQIILAQNQTTTTVTGSNAGLSGPLVSDNPENPQYCWVRKEQFYKMVTNSTTATGFSWMNGIVIPGGMREGYLYAWVQGAATASSSESVSYNSQVVAWQYTGYRTLFDTPDPSTCWAANIRKYYSAQYVPTTCNLAFGDTGQYGSVCGVIPMSNYAPDLPAYSKSVPPVNIYKGKSNLFTSGQQGCIGLSAPDWTTYQEVWLRISPDPDTGTIQQYNANYTCALGNWQVVYDLGLDAGPGGGTAAMGNLMTDFLPRHSYNFVGVT